MRLILLLLTTLALSLGGCSQKMKDCQPVPCTKTVCIFPKMPSYKTPQSKPFTKPIDRGDGTCIVVISELIELHSNKEKLSEICWKYNSINKRVNSKYQNRRSE